MNVSRENKIDMCNKIYCGVVASGGQLLRGLQGRSCGKNGVNHALQGLCLWKA